MDRAIKIVTHQKWVEIDAMNIDLFYKPQLWLKQGIFFLFRLLFFWKSFKPCDACVKITRPSQKKKLKRD